MQHTGPFSHILPHLSGDAEIPAQPQFPGSISHHTQPPFPMSTSHFTFLFNPSVAHRIQPLPASGQIQRPIFSYIRTLEGIVGTIDSPIPVTRVPALGKRANDLLVAQGFQTSSLRLILRMYEAADGDEGSFVDQLAGSGYPITEARLLYSLIDEQ
jgi:hypothetical protein